MSSKDLPKLKNQLYLKNSKTNRTIINTWNCQTYPSVFIDIDDPNWGSDEKIRNSLKKLQAYLDEDIIVEKMLYTKYRKRTVAL